jgi:hypothetical protein
VVELTQRPAWRVYQDEVSGLLTQLGFATKTDERIQGARGTHDIDVTARVTVAARSRSRPRGGLSGQVGQS